MNELAIGRSVGWSIAMENFKRAVQWTKDCFKMFLICSDRLYQNKFRTVLWFVFDSSAFNEYHEWIFLALEIRFCRNTFPSEWALSQTENGIVWKMVLSGSACPTGQIKWKQRTSEWAKRASKGPQTTRKAHWWHDILTEEITMRLVQKRRHHLNTKQTHSHSVTAGNKICIVNKTMLSARRK